MVTRNEPKTHIPQSLQGVDQQPVRAEPQAHFNGYDRGLATWEVEGASAESNWDVSMDSIFANTGRDAYYHLGDTRPKLQVSRRATICRSGNLRSRTLLGGEPESHLHVARISLHGSALLSTPGVDCLACSMVTSPSGVSAGVV